MSDSNAWYSDNTITSKPADWFTPDDFAGLHHVDAATCVQAIADTMEERRLQLEPVL